MLVALLLLIWIGISIWYEAPTCFDGKRNGSEAGIDCGGSCELVCSFQAVDPIVLWSRFFELQPGLYNAVVMIENPNTDVESEPVSYSFKLRDAENVLVAEERGEIRIPADRTIPLFIPNITTGNRIPVRSFFTFESPFVWGRTTHERPTVSVSNISLKKADTAPRLDATLYNSGSQTLSDIYVVAVLSDASGNAVAASRTVVPFLDPKQEANIFFTWPNAFGKNIASIDIIPTFSLSK